MPKTPGLELAGKLWRTAVVRGLTALALGASVLTQAPTSPAGVVRAGAAYWIVDGFIVLWAAAFLASLAVNRVLLAVRGGIAIIAGLTLFGLPLGMVFGPWQPGQGVLWMVVTAVALVAIVVQVLAGAFDVVLSLKIHRRVRGDWSFALGAALSIALGVIAAATLVVPATLLASTVGAVAVIGGVGLLAGAVRLRADHAHAPVSPSPHKP